MPNNPNQPNQMNPNEKARDARPQAQNQKDRAKARPDENAKPQNPAEEDF